MSDVTFGQRLARAFTTHGQLCVGVDPHPYLLKKWGLSDTAEGVGEFGLRVIGALHNRVGIVKVQVAFFERHGSVGFAALERVLAAARAAGMVVIADAKRGDVGSTVAAYGAAWLSRGSALEADAMTVSAFQGVGSLNEPIRLARESGKGLFVLAATSNPESAGQQSAVITEGKNADKTVAAGIVDDVIALNSIEPQGSSGARIGPLGVVLGATVDLTRLGIALDAVAAEPATAVLAPGFGHQGAAFSDLPHRFGGASPCVIATVSRSVLSAGPSGFLEAVTRDSGELAECLA